MSTSATTYRVICFVGLACLCSSAVSAQSLFHRRPGAIPVRQASPPASPTATDPQSPLEMSPVVVQPPVAPSGAPGEALRDLASPGAAAGPGTPPTAGPAEIRSMPLSQPSAPSAVRVVSLMAVIAPEPKMYRKHDKIDLIINQSSLSTSKQRLDANKKSDFTAALSQFPSLAKLFGDLEIRGGIGTPVRLGINSDDKFKGDGTYERSDKMTARISGLVMDVKPNGLLLIEASESIQQDEERKTMVISGLCDPKDISNGNTVQSSQLANLTIRVEHAGQIKDTATKGVITRAVEFLFNF